MSFANVQIGNSASDGNGDSLRSAFAKINQNFANIAESRFDVTVNAPVESVAGRTGDVVLTVNDIPGAATTGYVDAKTEFAISSARNYTDLQLSTSINNLIDSAPGALNTLNELATALNDDANFASNITIRISAIEQDLALINSGGDVEVNNIVEARVTIEESRAIAAEETLASDIAVLRTDLDSEVEDRAIADSTLQSNLDSAVTDLQAADANIESLLNTEISNRNTAVNTVQSNLDAEIQDRIDGDADLQSQINNILSNVDPAALDSLTEIVGAFQAADDNLNNAITALAGTASTDLANGLALKANIADLSAVATSGAYSDLSGTPTAVSAFSNDAGYITGIDFADVDNKPTTVDGYGITDAFDGQYSSLVGAPVLATVATSGDYNDLDNTPTIPSIAGLATTAYVDSAVAGLVDSAPEALNTLKELADAFTDNSDAITDLVTLVGTKAASADVYTKTEADSLLSTKANTADLATVAVTGNYNDLDGIPAIPPIPVNVSEFANDAGYLTSVTFADIDATPTTLAGYGISDAFDGQYTNLTGAPVLATVATSGDYNDLINKPSADTGNFTFSSNTLGVSDANGGITINANGNGEIVLSDNVGIKQSNPGMALHVGSVGDAAPSEIGIAVTYGNNNINGTASLQWDWNDGAGTGSNTNDTTEHARFGIFKNGLFSNPWLTFDRNAPADALEVTAAGELLVSGTAVALTPSVTSFEINGVTALVTVTGLAGADTIVIRPEAGYSAGDTQNLAFTGRDVVGKRTLVINTSVLSTVNIDLGDMMAPLTVAPTTVTEVIYLGNSEWFVISERAM